MGEQDTLKADRIHQEDQVLKDLVVIVDDHHESLMTLRFHPSIAKKYFYIVKLGFTGVNIIFSFLL